MNANVTGRRGRIAGVVGGVGDHEHLGRRLVPRRTRRRRSAPCAARPARPGPCTAAAAPSTVISWWVVTRSSCGSSGLASAPAPWPAGFSRSSLVSEAMAEQANGPRWPGAGRVRPLTGTRPLDGGTASRAAAAAAASAPEQAQVLAGLRVPLHRHRERVLRRVQLGRLDRAVGGPGGRGQPAAELVDGLVVMGGHDDRQVVGQVGAVQDRGQPAARRDADLVLPVAAGLGGVAVVADQVGQVLVQRAAQGHVHDLHAAADARAPAAAAASAARDQGQLGVVAVRVGRPAVRVARRAVAGRVDVAAAGQHQAVQAAGHRLDPGQRGQQHRDGPGRGHAGRVALGEQDGEPVPGAPAGRFAVGADADQWWHGEQPTRASHRPR